MNTPSSLPRRRARWWAAACVAGLAGTLAAGAGDAVPAEVRADNSGVSFTWPGFGTLKSEFPILQKGDRKDIKITERTIAADGKSARLVYEGGMNVTVTPQPDGQLQIAIENPVDDLKMVRLRTTPPPTFMQNGGTWAIDGQKGDFPREKGDKGHVVMANGKKMVLNTADGHSLAYTPQPGTFMEITDNRFWGGNVFMAIMNMPYYADRQAQVLALASPADAAVAVKVAAAPIPASKPVDPGKEPGATVVAKFKDAKDGAFSLTFDDGCDTHVTNAVPLFKKYRFPATFFIMPGTGYWKDPNVDRPGRFAKAIAGTDMVFGNHTSTHSGVTMDTLDEEFGGVNRLIVQLNPAQAGMPIAFAQPGGLKEGAWAITKEQMNDAFEKYHLLFRGGFTNGQMGLEAVLARVNGAVAGKKFDRVDYHGVGGDWLAVPTEELEATLQRMDELRDRLWVADLATALEYMKQRDAAKVESKAAGAGFEVTVTTPLDPEWFKKPLTLRTRVPADWTAATAKQGGRDVPVAVVDGVAQYDIVPNGGPLALSKD